MKTEKILQGVTKISIYLAVLLVPIFFLPITGDWYEWNKHYLLGILVVIALLAWLAQGLITKNLTITRTPFDLPLGVWWIFVLGATIFSKDRISSFFGPIDNVSWSFLALTFYVLLALLISWSISSERELKGLLNFLGIGSGIAVLYFWLARFGLFNALDLPRWNPSSSLNLPFGVMIVLMLLLGLGMLLIPKVESKRTIFWSILSGLLFITIVALGFQKIWIVLAIGLFFLLFVSFSRLQEIRYQMVSLAMAVFVISLVFIILGTPRFLTVNTPTEVTLAQPRSWQITFDTLKEGVKNALLGSGPGTFVNDFSTYRPASYNLGPTWAIRFSRPTATSYLILSETGILGSIAFLVVLLVGLGTLLQVWLKQGVGGKLRAVVSRVKAVVSGESASGNTEIVGIFFAVAVVWLTSIVSFFLVSFGTSLWVYFFVFLAILPLLGRLSGALPERSLSLSFKTTPQYALATSFIYIVVVTAVVIGGIFLGRFYGSEILAVKASRAASAQDYSKAEQLMGQTIGLNPYRAKYQLKLSRLFLRHAAQESRKTDSNTRLVGQLVGGAISASRRATELAPFSVASWEELSTMYANARPLSQEANNWVIASLDKAIELETTNPKFYVLRGNAYRLDNKLTEAKADFEKAIELKENYSLAHYVLSLVLESEQNIDAAVREAELAARYAPRDLNAGFSLGRLLYNRHEEGDWALAERIFLNNLTVNRDHANTLFALALIKERQGEVDDARALYNRLIELDPNNSAIKERLQRLPVGTPISVRPNPVNDGTVSDEESQTRDAVVE